MLALARDGSAAAFVDEVLGPGPLRIARAGRETLEVFLGPTEIRGPAAAVFGSDGTWLVTVDGQGALWRVSVTDGSSDRLVESAHGLVFGRWLQFTDDGRLIVNLVGSAEVPLPSFIASVDIESLSVDLLTEGGWERGGWPQADGSLAYAAILPEGGATRIMLWSERSTESLADLGIATWTDVSRFGDIVYSIPDGDIKLAQPGEPTRTLGVGSVPRISPDGDRVAVVSERGDAVVVYDSAGTPLDEIAGPFAGWARCPEGCLP